MTDTTNQNGTIVTNSILNTVKKMIGFESSYDIYDEDLKVYINTAFSTLQQLGVGPESGFSILSDEETWDLFLNGDVNLNPVKTYIYLRVKMLFDPPATSFGQEALKDTAKELEWRLNVYSNKEVASDELL